MTALIFVLFSVAIFLSVLIGGKKYRTTTLYALSIGGVVNANFFHAGNYPINIFGLSFGIDSIIYTLFVFCIILMFFLNGKKDAYVLLVSSVVAIIFSALMQLVSSLLSTGSSTIVWTTFFGFMVSAFASLVAIWIMLIILDKLKNKNCYFLTIIGILIATIINSGIYYPLSLLINGVPNNIGALLLSSLIGKVFAMGLALVTMFLLNKLDSKKEIK